ncbi:hypothetical protein GCM10027589_04690 [Actinocorallia lasiicapitis]
MDLSGYFGIHAAAGNAGAERIHAAIAEVKRTGDAAPLFALIDVLAVEFSTDAKSQAQVKEDLTAFVLFRAFSDAQSKGDQEAASMLAFTMKLMVSEETINEVINAEIVGAAVREGTLPADRYDKLMAYYRERDDHNVLSMIRENVRRVE